MESIAHSEADARPAPTWRERLEHSGIRRIGSPKQGFRYRRGRRAAGADALRRIRALRIPPAWTDVWVSADARARVQAIGRDRAGRDQYLYHARHVAQR